VIGAPQDDRLVVLALSLFMASGPEPTSVTIGGVTATKACAANLSGAFNPLCSIYYARLPTGTTADLVVTFASNPFINIVGVSVYRVIGADAGDPVLATATTATQSATQAVSSSIRVEQNGGLIACSGFTETSGVGTNITWVNATKNNAFSAGAFEANSIATSASRITAGSSTITANDVDGIGFAEVAVMSLRSIDVSLFGVIGAATCEY